MGDMVWLKALENSRHVRPIGLRWLSEKESDACSEAFAKGNATDPCRAHSVKAWRSATCVATGPTYCPLEPLGQEYNRAWWTDARRSRSLFFALAVDTPPSLWIDVGNTPESVAAAWELLRRRDEEVVHTKTFRFTAGEIPNSSVIFNEREDVMNLAYVVEIPMDDGRDPARMTLESAFSKSLMTAIAVKDAKGTSTLLGQVDYAPATLTADLAHFNNLSGARWPLDMPADVVCALMQHLVRPLDDQPSAAWKTR
jgi:hypothetical protein